jgi:uncharacterized membrane protein
MFESPYNGILKSVINILHNLNDEELEKLRNAITVVKRKRKKNKTDGGN